MVIAAGLEEKLEQGSGCWSERINAKRYAPPVPITVEANADWSTSPLWRQCGAVSGQQWAASYFGGFSASHQRGRHSARRSQSWGLETLKGNV